MEWGGRGCLFKQRVHLFSANARRVPFFVRMMVGIRKHLLSLSPAKKTATPTGAGAECMVAVAPTAPATLSPTIAPTADSTFSIMLLQQSQWLTESCAACRAASFNCKLTAPWCMQFNLRVDVDLDYVHEIWLSRSRSIELL